ncbi:protein DEHYDRATION-INDUCED 19 homolog 5 [Neltuma alba]|uniref:protein DEHYDRATION-INDUCED 19 homolog 5 n=1 Tax=Neltuma alba TaxID=207710 RepID=UPI0010A31C2C|nr:protein DEHYDRATION-INDUCED 19 homolog 5-like [Prosopis alba]
MDFDFRSFGLHPAKHLSAVQAARLHSDNLSVFYESDGDDDARSYFPCPFCYVEIEVPVLCSHLQEEHCFDLNNAVCPLCAANLGRDANAHFIVQHSSSVKRRRKPEKSNSLSGNSAMFGKKLVTSARGNRHDPTTDPLLYPFVCNSSIQNSDSVHQDELSNNVSTISEGNRAGDEKDQRERKQKADFAQQLITSTIFQELWW